MTTIANPMQRMGASRLVQLQFESLWPLVPPLMVVVGLFQRHEPFGREGSTKGEAKGAVLDTDSRQRATVRFVTSAATIFQTRSQLSAPWSSNLEYQTLCFSGVSCCFGVLFGLPLSTLN